MLDLTRFSTEQRQAILAGDGPLLILAGPGSGKTTVLAARIAYLILARHIAPATILAITFANKAARELRLRLAATIGASAAHVDVTTFHAFGLRLIRRWRESLGYGPGPLVVLDSEEAHRLLEAAANGVDLDLTRYSLADLTAAVSRHRLDGATASAADPIPHLAQAYETLLQRRQAVDFPAMLTLPLRLFDAHPEVLDHYQTLYRFVLCDEYQDVCATQNDLLRRLVALHGNLVAVGDPCQTLYAWRGADVRRLLDFRRDFPTAQVLRLHHNFRSTQAIVDVANTLGARLPYGHVLRTDNAPGVTPHLYLGTDEVAEAQFVAREIARLDHEQGIDSLGDVAVLFRTHRQAHALTLALRHAHIPYVVRGQSDLFTRPAVRDALAYLRLAHNPADGVALTRIINTPPRGLGRLGRVIRDPSASLTNLPSLAEAYGRTAAANAQTLVSLIDELHEARAALPLPELLDLALDTSGYRAWLADQVDGAQGLAHLAALRELLAQAQGDWDVWLADIQLGDGDDPHGEADRVVLTTIHQAKGGEWQVVFIVGVEEGLLPHARAINATASSDGVEGELRVAYVAVTRPRERMYLTGCQRRQQGDLILTRQPSRFLRGLPLDPVGGAA